MNILVTGVGGGVGQSIIKSLQNTPHTVIGVDGEVLGTGLYAVAKAYKIPYANAPGYIERLLDICKKENCCLLFPGLDAELSILSQNIYRFKEIGTTPVVSSPEIIATCDDKLLTSRFLITHKFNAPMTFSTTDDIFQHLTFPMILKPRKGGARSKGVFIVSNERELIYRLSTVDISNYIAQEYLEGDEYTCGSVNFGGCCYGIIIMRRILRDGDTYKAFIIVNPDISNYVKTVAETLKPFGPCNFQLRIRDGQPYIFEINPRCSGTTHCRTLAGFNEPLMTINYLLYNDIPLYKIQKMSFLRYWSELIVENSHIAELREHEELIGDGSKL